MTVAPISTPTASRGRRRLLLQEPRTIVRKWRGIMKALIAALALVTLIASPSFAQSYPGEHVEQSNVSPASPNFGDNGY